MCASSESPGPDGDVKQASHSALPGVHADSRPGWRDGPKALESRDLTPEAAVIVDDLVGGHFHGGVSIAGEHRGQGQGSATKMNIQRSTSNDQLPTIQKKTEGRGQ